MRAEEDGAAPKGGGGSEGSGIDGGVVRQVEAHAPVRHFGPNRAAIIEFVAMTCGTFSDL